MKCAEQSATHVKPEVRACNAVEQHCGALSSPAPQQQTRGRALAHAAPLHLRFVSPGGKETPLTERSAGLQRFPAGRRVSVIIETRNTENMTGQKNAKWWEASTS